MREIGLKCKYSFECECSELSHYEIMDDDIHNDEVRDALYHDVIPEIQAKLQRCLGVEVDVSDIDIRNNSSNGYFIAFFTVYDDMGLYGTAEGISKVVGSTDMDIEKAIIITIQSEKYYATTDRLDPPVWDEWDCDVCISCTYDTSYGIKPADITG